MVLQRHSEPTFNEKRSYLEKHLFADLLKDLEHLAAGSQGGHALVDQVTVRQVDNVAPLHSFKNVVVLVQPQ